MTRKLALAFAEAGLPIVPVNVFRRGDRWRKEPYVSWRGEKNQATTHPAKIKEWWGRWPSAMPGLLLRDNVIVDADRHQGKPDGVELLRTLGPFPSHPVIPSKSNGEHHWYGQPPKPIRYERWAGGEVLGLGRLVIGYAVPQGPIPILPEMFWPDGHGSVLTPKRVPSKVVDRDHRWPPRHDPVLVGDLTAALQRMDPCEWHGEHDLWFELLMGCKYVGISVDDFIEWSTQDPDYADDAEIIAKKWHSIEPKHGGAFWRELSARGIKVTHNTLARHPSSYVTVNWWARLNSVLDKLRAKRDGDMLFWAACRVAETMADTGMPRPSVAVEFLVGAVRPVIKREEAVRVIGNAFSTVEQQILNA